MGLNSITKFNYCYIFNLLLLIGISGCEKALDINQSPNAPTTAAINTVLTNITVNVGFMEGSDLHRFTSLWVQQFGGQGGAGSPNVQFEKYNALSTDFINLWQTFYSITLEDVEYIINHSEESPHYNGVAKILKAWCFQQMVDVWGDIPFTEALQVTAIKYPKFDSGKNIYPQLLALLDDGIAKLSKAEGPIPMASNETIYSGNMSKWIKMANTLKMRIYLHYSEIDPAKLKAGIDAIVNAGLPVIDANEDNFQMAFVDAPNAQNPIHQFELRQANQFFPNYFLVSLMSGKSDPRSPFYFTPFPYNSTPTTYKGVNPGDPQSFNYSRLNTYLRGDMKNNPIPLPDGSLTATAAVYSGAAPIKMLTAAEYYFIRAESALRFGTTGDAPTLYQSGIRASMELVGVNDADIDSYVTAHPLPAGTMDEQLKILIEEKYVALYGVALEPYNDWRRTGYPSIKPVLSGTITTIPTIFYYPQSEVNANPNCKQKNSLNEKVFWDK